MSQTSKIVLGIAVVVVLAAGGYYYWHQKQEANAPQGIDSDVTALPSGTSSSDASIEQDLSAIDSQIKAAGNDNASASASVDAAAAQ